MQPVTRFEGFTPAALRLLGDLRRHNERAWFVARKDRFEKELLEPMRALVRDATRALEKAKIPIGGDPKRSMFRIYRDVRFGHDKSPYKTHLAAYLSYDGGRDTPGGIYIHIEPERSSLAVAFYRLDKPILQRWRDAMAAEPAAFRRVLRALERRNLPLEGPEHWDDSLVRMPRGFEDQATSELAPFYRLRSFCAGRSLATGDVTSRKLVTEIVACARDAKPLLQYGWALD